MDMFITIVSALVTGIGMILGKYLFRYLSLNYLDKVKMASKLQRKINQDITKIYSLTNSDRVSLFKFANGEHYLSDEPVLKVIREYNSW